MAAFNTRIVRRGDTLQGFAYGRELRYAEVMGTGRGPLGAAAAVAVTGGLFAFLTAMAVPPTRALLDHVLRRARHRAEHHRPRARMVPHGGRGGTAAVPATTPRSGVVATRDTPRRR